MFTGIVRERGRVVLLDRAGEQVTLALEAPLIAAETEIGDSIAVDGCCLTLVGKEGVRLSFDLSAETLARTAFARAEAGTEVNLEPALRAGDPLGGHYVQGHVDAVGRVRSVEPEAGGARMWIEVPPALMRYCVEKGSLCVAGVSLTIAELATDAISVALIPYTLQQTTLGIVKAGDPVNLEADVLAKYVERLLPGDRES